jgi:hypothetical protein
MLNVTLREIEYYEIGLYARLDDWIIFGLKNENQIINQKIDEIKDCVQN